MENEKLNTSISQDQKPSAFSRMKKSLGRFFKKTLLWTGLIVILAGTIYLSFARYASYSKGTRSGKIFKFSKKGTIFKTYEGEINTGDFANGQWSFSVYPGNADIQHEITNALEAGDQVKVKYKQRYFKIFFWGDTEYFIYDVDKVCE